MLILALGELHKFFVLKVHSSSRAVAEAHFKSFVSVIHATFNRFPITQKVKTRTISHARSINLKITVEFHF